MFITVPIVCLNSCFFAGNILSDFFVVDPPKEVLWPNGGLNSGFIDIYDWDVIILNPITPNFMVTSLHLCVGLNPCSLHLRGAGESTLRPVENVTMLCKQANGCHEVNFDGIQIECSGGISATAFLEFEGSVLHVQDCKFSSCKSSFDGGIILGYSSALVMIHSSSFINLSSDGFGGAIALSGATSNIWNCTFVNCSAFLSGGAVSAVQLDYFPAPALASAVIINNSLFLNCSSQVSGGAVASIASKVDILFTSFVRCSSFAPSDSGGSAGAVSVSDSSSLTVRYTNFTGCASLNVGGAISASTSQALIHQSLFDGNQADLGGGAIYLDYSPSELKWVVFKSNIAPAGGGGALLWRGIQPDIIPLCNPGTWAQGPVVCKGGVCSTNCSSCAAGTFQGVSGADYEDGCSKCSAGKFGTAIGASSASVCISCFPGYFSFEASTSCLICQAGKFSAFEGDSCISCAPGKYSRAAATSECTVCQPALFSKQGSTSCISCAAGTYGVDGMSSCLQCAEGMFADSAAATACNSCAPGKYSGLGSSICKSCSAGSYAAAGYMTCLACDAGKFSSVAESTNTSICAECSPGSFSSILGSSVCLLCSAGQFALLGASYCDWCSSGKYSTSIRAGAPGVCIECTAGTYSPMGSSACLQCSAGTYSTIGSSGCALCPGGMYSSAIGFGTCTVCDGGFFSTAGSTTCSSCGAGTYSISNGSYCAKCSVGKYSYEVEATNSSACFYCAAGKFATESGLDSSTACTTCPAGTYSTLPGASRISTCAPCEQGKYASQSGASSCDQCQLDMCSLPNTLNTTRICNDTVLCRPHQFAGSCILTCAQGFLGGPSFGKATYQNNQYRVWIISVPMTVSILLTFTKFSTEAGYDTLLVYGCTDLSCSVAQELSLLGNFSGFYSPGMLTLTTYNFSALKLVWSSDNMVTNIGWSAIWETFTFGQTTCTACENYTDLQQRNLQQRKKSFSVVKRSLDLQATLQAGGILISFPDFTTSSKNFEASQNSLFAYRKMQTQYSLNTRIVRKKRDHLKNFAILQNSIELHRRQSIASDEIDAFSAVKKNAGNSSSLYTGGRDMQRLLIENPVCPQENNAAYGPCLASFFDYLELSLGTSNSVYPGEMLSLTVRKLDAYGQVITTDSISIVTLSASWNGEDLVDPSVSIVGALNEQMSMGKAVFTVSFKPTFIDVTSNSTTLLREPYIVGKGLDQQTGNMMSSVPSRISMCTGRDVCPVGYILALDRQLKQGPSAATCAYCPEGTYSINPLTGSPNPSCLNCPVGAVCNGGADIHFAIGIWVPEGGMFLLISCPAGYQLINSIGGHFSHDNQQCLACREGYYILDSNNSLYECQQCPAGAQCTDHVFTSRLNGAIWQADFVQGVWLLEGCPPGYELQPSIENCSLCSAGHFCAGGSAAAAVCPLNMFSAPGSNSSMDCIPVVFVSLVFSIPVLASAATADTKELFVDALAAAAGTSAGNVLIDGWTAERRSAASMVTIRIVASNLEVAATFVSKLQLQTINLELTIRGLPAGTIISVSINQETSGLQTVSTEYLTVGIICGILLVMVFASLTVYFIFSTRIIETAEEALVRKKVRELRTLLFLRREDGFLVKSEETPYFYSHKTINFIAKRDIQAAARLALFVDFEIRHFDSLCSCVENLQYSESGTKFSVEPIQYTNLCKWLLEVSSQLLHAEFELEIPRRSIHDMSFVCRANKFKDSAARFDYLVNEVCRARIWSSNNHCLFLKLKDVAHEHLGRISRLCDNRCLALLHGKDGEKLRSFQWPNIMQAQNSCEDDTLPLCEPSPNNIQKDREFVGSSRLACAP